jgi:hypothetical protein
MASPRVARSFIPMLIAAGSVAALRCAHAAPEASEIPGAPGAISIRFEMPHDGFATLALYKSNGQMLRPLAQLLELSKGAYAIRWDGMDLWGNSVSAGTEVTAKVITHPGVKVLYEFSPASPNKIPWPSKPFGEGENVRKGGWLGDHSPPSAVVAMGDRVIMACSNVEYGAGMLIANLEGEKMADGGPAVDFLTTDGTCLYALSRGRTAIGRIEVDLQAPPSFKGGKGKPLATLSGPAEALAVRGGTMYLTCAEGKAKEGPLSLQIRKADTGELKAEIRHESVAALTRMAFAPDGKLYALVGGKLCLTEIDENAKAARHRTLNDKAFKKPISLAVDAKGGRIAVGDEGRDAVVVLDPAGKVLFVVGDIGTRKRGPWDPHMVDRPCSVTFDARGKLWVVENFFTPKRISRFSEQGKIEKAFHGPPHYGGGGFLDPNLKSFFYEAIEYELDWAKGTSRLANLNDVQFDPHSPDLHPGTYSYTKVGRPLYVQGRRYVVGDVGSQFNPGFTVCLLEGPAWKPCATMGSAMIHGKDSAKLSPFLQKAHWQAHWASKDLADCSFIWCDRNGDGEFQIDEVEIFKNSEIPGALADGGGGKRRWNPFGGAYWGNRCGPDLTFWGPNARLAPSRFTDKGVPIYEKKNLQAFRFPLPELRVLKKNPEQISQVLFNGDLAVGGQPYLITPELKIRGGEPAGKAADFMPPVLGEKYGGLSFVGHVQTASPVGELLVLNGNGGLWHIVTRDALLVGNFFTGREGGWGDLYPERGMDVTHRRHAGETFFGDFIKAQDGKYYCVSGKGWHGVCRVEGMDDFRVAEIPVAVSAADFAKNQAERATYIAAYKSASEKKAGPPSLECAPLARRTRNFKLDGDLADWPDIQKRPGFGPPELKLVFDAAYDPQGLYLAYAGQTFLGNGAQDPKYIFNTGFGLDFRVRSDVATRVAGLAAGDKRFVFAPYKGQWIAVLYDYVNPKAPAGERYVFTSPVKKMKVDRVVQLPDGAVKIAFKGGDAAKKGERAAWTAEVFVPWDAIGIKPSDRMEFRADAGVLCPDSGGIQSDRQFFWAEAANTEVTDVAHEAAIHPGQWGTVRLGR